MSIRSRWLSQLKVPQLHRLAVLLGTPCSGNKVVRIAAIEEALSLHRLRAIGQNDGRSRDRRGSSSENVSLVSIDMGIRNLAFAHLTARVRRSEDDGVEEVGPVVLRSWRKIDVSRDVELSTTGREKVKSTGTDDQTGKSVTGELSDKPGSKESLMSDSSDGKGNAAESFDPAVYAERAFSIMRWIVHQYKPTHILIERQRFRSGGSSAVLEWTIRVGVFEGMLYAVLKTLYGIEAMSEPVPVVEGILPMRVNRFWLEGGNDDKCAQVEGLTSDEGDSKSKAKARSESTKMVGKEVKRAKIDLVSRLLEDGSYRTNNSERCRVLPLEVSKDVDELVKYFRSEVDRFGTRRRKKVDGGINLTKLDDLADCLLQGLAWLNWQNNLARVDGLGERAFDLGDEVGGSDGKDLKGGGGKKSKGRKIKGIANTALKCG